MFFDEKVFDRIEKIIIYKLMNNKKIAAKPISIIFNRNQNYFRVIIFNKKNFEQQNSVDNIKNQLGTSNSKNKYLKNLTFSRALWWKIRISSDNKMESNKFSDPLIFLWNISKLELRKLCMKMKSKRSALKRLLLLKMTMSKQSIEWEKRKRANRILCQRA